MNILNKKPRSKASAGEGQDIFRPVIRYLYIYFIRLADGHIYTTTPDINQEQMYVYTNILSDSYPSEKYSSYEVKIYKKK